MSAATAEPLSVAAIDPDTLYGLKDFARLVPARQGGRLSPDHVRRWAIQGKFGFFNMAPAGCKHRHFVVYGRDILAAIALAHKAAQPSERMPTPAEWREQARRDLQNLADRTGKTINNPRLGQFVPRKQEEKS